MKTIWHNNITCPFMEQSLQWVTILLAFVEKFSSVEALFLKYGSYQNSPVATKTLSGIAYCGYSP